MTGTDEAYLPPGSLLRTDPVSKPALDGYTAWKPE